MENKDLIGLAMLCAGVIGCTTILTLFRASRDAAFFFMTAGAVVTDRLDINFHSQYWYRGTTRGLEVSFIDVLALGLWIASLLRPSPGHRRWFWPASLGLMLLYFVYAALSVAMSEPKVYGVFELSKIFRGILIFLATAVFVQSRRELTVLICALCCAAGFEGLLAFKERYWDQVHRVTGSLEHPNSLSMYLCLVAPVLLAASLSALPRWLRFGAMAASALAGFAVLLTISRAGIPAFALVMLGTAAFCVSWRFTWKKLVAAAFIAMGVAVVVQHSWSTLKERYAEATFADEYLDDKTEGRGYYLRMAQAIAGDRFFGVGLNNWSYWVSKRYGAWLDTPYEDYDDLESEPNKDDVESFHYAAPAHSLAALTVGELGVPGLLLFAMLWLRWFQMGMRFLRPRDPDAVRRIGIGIFFGLCGVFIQSITEWTFRQSHILLTFHVLAGALASLCWMPRRVREIEARAVESQMDNVRELEFATAE